MTVRIQLDGHDDVFDAAAAIEELAHARGVAVTRADQPIPDIDYSLADLLCLRRSDVELAIAGDDAAWTDALAAQRARFPGVTFTIA